jgi:hypothetical protein
MSSRLLELARNPFPGLRSFQEDEDFLFFGREGQITELLKRLRKQHFLAVVGTSGSGKSSLIRAGLIPALHRGVLVSAGSKWEVLYTRPGGSPMENLARVLEQSDLYEPSNELFPRLLACLNRSRSGLIDAIRQSNIDSETNLLLVIDQFEEVFRFRRRDEESLVKATDFVAALLEASMRSQRRVYIIVTLRSDFLGDCSMFPGLAEAVNRGEYLIPRMSREELRDAILNPIRVAGGSISNRLLQKLLNRVSDNHDQLPLLQHALMRTWDAWEQGHPDHESVDLSHFESSGEIEFAISQHADEVLSHLPEHQRHIAERLFKALTEMGSDSRETRRPTRLEDLQKIVDCKEDDLLAVIDAFRDKNCAFITPTQGMTIYRDTFVDISHESLMRAWTTLRGWVQEEYQSARIYRRLAETATLHAEGKSGLYRDPDLQVAIAWRNHNPTNPAWASRYHEAYRLALKFLDRSQTEQKRETEKKEIARQKELEQSRALAELQSRRAEESQQSARRSRITSMVMAGLAVIGIALSVTSVFFFLRLQESDRNRYKEERQSLVNMRIAEERTRFVIKTTNRLSSDVDDIPQSVRYSFIDLFRNEIEQLGNQNNADKKNSETNLVAQLTLLWSLCELDPESHAQIPGKYAILLENAENFITEISKNGERIQPDKWKASLQLQRLLGTIYFRLKKWEDSNRFWEMLIDFTETPPEKINLDGWNDLIVMNSRLDAFLHRAQICDASKRFPEAEDLIKKACGCEPGILDLTKRVSELYEVNEAFGLLADAYHQQALIEKKKSFDTAADTATQWFLKSDNMIQKIQGGVGSKLAKIREINRRELQEHPPTMDESPASLR